MKHKRVRVLIFAGGAAFAFVVAAFWHVSTGPAWLAQLLWRYGTVEPPAKAPIPIVGRRLAEDPGHYSYRHFDRWENGLADLVNKRQLNQVYALLCFQQVGPEEQVVVVEAQGRWTVHVFTNDPRSAYRVRSWECQPGDLGLLRESLSNAGIDRLKVLRRLLREPNDGKQFEYVEISRASGRRLFLNNPCAADRVSSRHCEIVEAFKEFLAEAEFEAEAVRDDHLSDEFDYIAESVQSGQ